MNTSGLKAREIEALVYIQSPQPSRAPESPGRPRVRTERATAAGLAAGVVVVAAALAWLLLHG